MARRTASCCLGWRMTTPAGSGLGATELLNSLGLPCLFTFPEMLLHRVPVAQVC